MRRYLPLCVLVTLAAHLSGCGESPSRPSVVTDRPVSPPKTSARYIQVPWDISLFFNIPGGAVVADATTAATSGSAAAGDNLTGTYSNTNGFGGTITGVLTGSLDNGSFDGTLSTVTPSGCIAERRFSGPLTSAALNWSPGNQVNDCGGTSPLTTPVQAAAAPPTTQPPCTYSAAVTQSSFPASGGTGTANVTAGTGCTWFANTTATFVTVSAGQGSGTGSVPFTVTANTSTSSRTATLVIAGQSLTITQAGAPAACTYALNGTGRIFDANGATGGVDMRTATGCGWQAVSDAPWLTVTSGASGSGNGTISFAVAANPGLGQRVGTISAAGQIFTVTQNGISCVYTVTGPSTTSFPFNGGTGSASVTTPPVCAWTATSSVPWITINPPGGGTGDGTVTFSVIGSPDPVVRTGTLTIAGQAITITEAAAPCAFALTPSTTSIPAAGGAATVAVATHQLCRWTATVSTTAPWITVTAGGSGTGNGTVALSFAANTSLQPRTGAVSVGDGPATASTVTFTQAAPTVGTLTGTVLSAATGGPIPGGAIVRVGNLAASTAPDGSYTLSNVPVGVQSVSAEALAHVTQTVSVAMGVQTTQNFLLQRATPTLVFTFSPDPAVVDPANLHCGVDTASICWIYDSTIQNTGGATLSVTDWEINLYDPSGALVQHNAFITADFANFYRGATSVPAFSFVAGRTGVFFANSAGGAIEIIVAGTDDFGRAFRFVTSPRLIAQAFVIPLQAAPGAGAPAPAPPPRPLGGPAGAIRRR